MFRGEKHPFLCYRKEVFQTLIFDLDDTLIDTSRYLLPIAGTAEFARRIRQPLPLLPGVRETLRLLHPRYDLHLLTQGRIEIQKQKLESSQLSAFFSEVFFVDPSKGESKGEVFHQLSQRKAPALFLSVGNRRSTDIREAKRYGMKTCFFRYGEHADEEPECPEDEADFEVTSFAELIERCQL
ncbi:MAG: hypothetical protein C5B49_12775 [Bdellovibrio sp.]|nr:MAG: hypothetical protein C5B49_12775 [Bdellovibrio sp.]